MLALQAVLAWSLKCQAAAEDPVRKLIEQDHASTICVDLIESCCCVAEVTRQPLVELRQCRPELLYADSLIAARVHLAEPGPELQVVMQVLHEVVELLLVDVVVAEGCNRRRDGFRCMEGTSHHLSWQRARQQLLQPIINLCKRQDGVAVWVKGGEERPALRGGCLVQAAGQLSRQALHSFRCWHCCRSHGDERNRTQIGRAHV